MKVGPLDQWVRHLNRGDARPRPLYQHVGSINAANQVWTVGSQSNPRAYYTVTYWLAPGAGEYIQCNCQAGRYGLKCKHSATVLAEIHPQQMRNLLRQSLPR